MVESLVLVALALAALPAFMSQRRRVWQCAALYACAVPFLAAALAWAVRSTAGPSYGLSLAGALVAFAGGGLSVVVALASLVIGLVRSRGRAAEQNATEDFSRTPRRASRRRGPGSDAA